MGREEKFAQAREARLRQGEVARQLERTSRSAVMSQPVVDRFGVPITENDLVMYRPPMDMVFRVREVKPVLHPGAPPGLAVVVLEVVAPVQVQLGVHVHNLVVVGTANEMAGDGKADEKLADTAEKPPESGLVDPSAPAPSPGLVDGAGQPMAN